MKNTNERLNYGQFWDEKKEYHSYRQFKKERDIRVLAAIIVFIIAGALLIYQSIADEEKLFVYVLIVSAILLLFSTLIIQKPYIFEKYEMYKNIDASDVYVSQMKRYLIADFNNIKELIPNDIEQLKSSLFDSTNKEIKYQHLLKELYSLEKKYNNYIDRIRDNASFNLILGLIIGAFGLIFMGIQIDLIRIKELYEMLPRITFFIFIEILSYFFLNLYRQLLNDIKYFQNEMSNLSFKITAIKLSLELQNEDNLLNNINILMTENKKFDMKNENVELKNYLIDIINILKK